MNITDYILLPIEERKAHIDLTLPCILDRRRKWTHQKNALLDWFNVTNNSANWLYDGIHRCHACSNDSQASQVCINPKHWWIGTASENMMSRPLEKRQAGGKATKGVPKSLKSISKRVEKLRGRTRTEEQRKKMSDSHKGKFFWITNGSQSAQHPVNLTVPPGWRKGRTINRKGV